MPEDLKRNQDKNEKKRNDPKEQRKPRNVRNQANRLDKTEESRSAPKVIVPPQKPPVYEDPGPEFYKNLKRETEEILKITEEEHSKYKKKEIQSNWSKYEMPIESYDDIEEHDVGADYEKLIQAPLSIGGHFQFKHEKSWDINTGPSLYDKYFEMSMDNLSLAMSTIPFYERNDVDTYLFSETDMLSMNNRATKYKQKYYDDKSYSTPETVAQDRILNSLKEGLSAKSKNLVDDNVTISSEKISMATENVEEDRSDEKDYINLDFNAMKGDFAKTDVSSPVHSNEEIKDVEDKPLESKISSGKSNDDIDDLILNATPKMKQEIPVEKTIEPPKSVMEIDSNKKSNEPMKVPSVSKSTEAHEVKVSDIPVETKKNPVIESPEDLEKWLDDFLDG